MTQEMIPVVSSESSSEPDPFYSPENQAYVLKSVRELREGKGTPHELLEAESCG